MLRVVEQAAQKVGGITKLAESLGINHQAFYSWRRVPAERVAAISQATGIPAHELRPDLWPAPEQTDQSDAA